MQTLCSPNALLVRLTCLALLLALPAFAAPATPSNPQATIALLPDIELDYRTFVGARDVQTITSYHGPGARRDVIELVLMQQALALGGFEQPLTFVAEENYLRSIRNVIDGKTLTISGTIWQRDLIKQQDKLHISAPTVKDGEFVVGIYTVPSNSRALASKTLAQLTQLRVATSSQWKPDLETLQSLGFKKFMFSHNWVNIARMLNAGRVDIALSPIASSLDKSIQVEGITLVPIEGIKVAIRGSRHWPVSKKHPLGKAFFQALSRGIEQLEREGTIARAYRECGFFHPELAHWQLLSTALITDAVLTGRESQ